MAFPCAAADADALRREMAAATALKAAASGALVRFRGCTNPDDKCNMSLTPRVILDLWSLIEALP